MLAFKRYFLPSPRPKPADFQMYYRRSGEKEIADIIQQMDAEIQQFNGEIRSMLSTTLIAVPRFLETIVGRTIRYTLVMLILILLSTVLGSQALTVACIFFTMTVILSGMYAYWMECKTPSIHPYVVLYGVLATVSLGILALLTIIINAI